MNEKRILIDCDGVLLDWVTPFHRWMDRKGFKRTANALSWNIHDMYEYVDRKKARRLTALFNESAEIGFMSPLPDAIRYVNALANIYKYKFTVITCLSTDPYACALRTKNLNDIFGSAIERVIYLNQGESKYDTLKEWKDTGYFFIDDYHNHVESARELGLSGVLMRHSYNKDYIAAQDVYNWNQLYGLITGE